MPNKEEICKLYFRDRLSTTKLAKQFRCSSRTIKLLIERSGFKLRSLSEAGKGKLGKESSHWKGGKRHLRGYVLICDNSHPFRDCDNYVPEHRLVMEKHLGRFLNPKEIVHHKNNKPSDNDIKNLVLFKNQAEHWRYHRKEVNNAK